MSEPASNLRGSNFMDFMGGISPPRLNNNPAPTFNIKDLK